MTYEEIQLSDIANGNNPGLYIPNLEFTNKATSAGDFNGDGFADLIIGGYGYYWDEEDNFISGAGTVYVVFGGSEENQIDLESNVDSVFKIIGVDVEEPIGANISAAGDVNGDGYDDIIILEGNYFDGNDVYVEGTKNWVIFGNPDLVGSEISINDIDAGNGGFVIENDDENISTIVSSNGAGDINGDGLDDVVITTEGEGEFYVVFGTTSTEPISLSNLDDNGFAIKGLPAGVEFYGPKATAKSGGDINGDGLDDLILGGAIYAQVYGLEDGGKAYVVFGKTDSSMVFLPSLSSGDGTGFVINGNTYDIYDYSSEEVGEYVSGVGDVNGDGLDDVIVSALYADTIQESYSGNSLKAINSFKAMWGTSNEEDGPLLINGKYDSGLGWYQGFVNGWSLDVNFNNVLNDYGGGLYNNEQFISEIISLAFFETPDVENYSSLIQEEPSLFAAVGESEDENPDIINWTLLIKGILNNSSTFLWALKTPILPEDADYVLDINGDGEITESDKVYDFSGDGIITAADLVADETVVLDDGIITGIDLTEDDSGVFVPDTVGDPTTYGTSSFFMYESDTLQPGLVLPNGSYYLYKDNVGWGSFPNNLDGYYKEVFEYDGTKSSFGVDDEDHVIETEETWTNYKASFSDPDLYAPSVNVVIDDIYEVELGFYSALVNASEITGWQDMSYILKHNPSWVIEGNDNPTWFDIVEEFGVGISSDYGLFFDGTLEDYMDEMQVFGVDLYEESFVPVVNFEGENVVIPGAEKFFPATEASGQEINYFDANGDGFLGYSDVVIDLNGDGEYTLQDMTLDLTYEPGNWSQDEEGDWVKGEDGGSVSWESYTSFLGLSWFEGQYLINNGFGENSGAAYVVFGKEGISPINTSDLKNGKGGFIIQGTEFDGFLGQQLSSAGDVNGDGLADIFIGANDDNPYGKAYVVFGTSNTSPIKISEIEDGNGGGFVISGSENDEYYGDPIYGAGDVNGDNVDDLIVTTENATYVIYNPSNVDYSKINFNTFSLSSLDDINDLNFESLGKNYKKLKWEDIDYSELNDASLDAIDWAKVDLKKATKSESFDIAAVDWTELNASKSAAKSYKAIDWANVSISSEVSAKLDYSKVDFNKFSPSSLDDINDLNFSSLGKNYKKLNWEDIDYSELSDASLEAIDWAQVDLNKAIKSSTFDLDLIDWTELNSSKASAKAYKIIQNEYLSTPSGGISLLNNDDDLISSDIASKLDYSKINFKTFSPSSLANINDLKFTDLGKNYKKLKWDQIDYSALSDASKNDIDWAQVNLKKAAKADTFTLDTIDWSDINSSTKAAKLYDSIDWATESISTEVAADLDFSKVNFNKLNLNNLNDINDLKFTELGKNYKKLKWDEIDYSALDSDSISDIEWDKVNLKKAAKADTFTLDTIDWSDINSSTKSAKLYNSIDWATESISTEVAADLDFSKINFNKLNLNNLNDINDLNFVNLGKNYKKLKWDNIDYSALDSDSISDIEWDKVNLKKAAKADSFTLDTVDWADINSSTKAAKLYNSIDWATESISSEVAADLDFSKINFNKLNLNNLNDINDLDFVNLGKNYKKLKWDDIDYSQLNETSIDEIDWTKINPKLASHSETFSLDTIDWDEISDHKVEVELYKLITEEMLQEASKETLSKLNTDLLNENNLLPSSSFFSEIPEPFDDYEILAGSSGTDEITGLPGQFIFFGEESDNILSKKGADKLNIFYGTGQYQFEKGTFTVAYTGGLYDITNFKINELKMWEISDGSEWGSFQNNPLFVTDGITKLLISNPDIYQPYFKIGEDVFSNPLNQNLGKYYQGSATSESLQNNGYLNPSTIQPLIDNNLAIFQTNNTLII